MLSQTAILFFIVIFAMHISLYAIGGTLLLTHRKEQHDRTRIFLGSFMHLMSLSIIAFLVEGMLIAGGFTEFFRKSLPAYPMISFYFVWILLPCYLVEMLRPYYLNRRRVLRSLSLPLVIFGSFIIWHATQNFGDYTPIYTIEDIFNNIEKIDVLFRLLLVIFFIFTGFTVFFIPKDWRRSNAPQPYFNVLAILVCAFSITFIFGMIMRLPFCMLLHYVILDTFCIISLYVEFRVRIPVPTDIAEETIVRENHPVESEYCSPELVKQLQDLIDTNVWKNPELKLDELCSTLGTNRTYLGTAIHALGYANYTDMLAQLRAQYVRCTINKEPNARLLDVFFQAGFRNRSTACRAFQKLYGCLPSVYQKQRQEETK